MILRATIANIQAKELATRIQFAGLNATVFPSWGAGSWGVEEGATAEFVMDSLDDPSELVLGAQEGGSTLHNHVRDFLVYTLRAFREEAAYLTVDGRRAFLLHAGAWRSNPDVPRHYVSLPVMVKAL
jgi:hypothetical protein